MSQTTYYEEVKKVVFDEEIITPEMVNFANDHATIFTETAPEPETVQPAEETVAESAGETVPEPAEKVTGYVGEKCHYVPAEKTVVVTPEMPYAGLNTVPTLPPSGTSSVSIIAHAPQKYAGLTSVHSSYDETRNRQIKRATTYETGSSPTRTDYSEGVTAIQKGPEPGLTKIQRVNKKRDLIEAQGSIVFKPQYDPSAKTRSAGDVKDLGHSVDATQLRQQTYFVPYEPVEVPDLPTKKTIGTIREDRWDDAAGQMVRQTAFGENDRMDSIAPYDSRNAFDKTIIKRVATENCETLGENAAGNVGDKCHYILHEKTVADSGVVPYEEANVYRSQRGQIEGRIEETTKNSAGNTRQRGHYIVSEATRMQKKFIVPYSDEPDVLRRGRTIPSNEKMLDAAGNVKSRGHVQNDPVGYNDSKVVYPSILSRATGDYTGSAGKESGERCSTRENHETAVAPYDCSSPFTPQGVKRVGGTRSDQKSNIDLEYQIHTKSEIRGMNTIEFGHPRDVEIPQFRSSIKKVENENAEPTERVIVGEKHVTWKTGRKHIPTVTTMFKDASPHRRIRADAGSFKPLDNSASFVHQSHEQSECGAPAPIPIRTQKRVFAQKPTTGIAPYEKGRIDVFPTKKCETGTKAAGKSTGATEPSPFRHMNTATQHRHHLQSSSMMDVLQPIYAHHQK